MEKVEADNRFVSALTEAANRAEVSALLIRCGYRVYRPEADTHGEDLVVRMRDGTFLGAQLKGRATVNCHKYGSRDLMMLFPSAPYKQDLHRDWYLVPHDKLFAWVEEKHGAAPKWNGEWSYPSLSKHLAEFLSDHRLRPLDDPADRFVEDGVGLIVLDPDGRPYSPRKSPANSLFFLC